MNPTPAAAVYEFGEFRLDTGKRLLLRGRDLVLLPARVLDTLICLVEGRTRLLTKSILIEKVWPDMDVEENSLSRNISILRRALGDASRPARYIRTEQGRGYRFIADVRELEIARANPSTAGARADVQDLIQQARTLSVRPSRQNLHGALTLMHRALQLDPDCALAYSMLARVYATHLVFDLPVEGGVAAAERAARRALELDSNLGDARAALAGLRAMQGRWLESERHFRSALSLGSQPDTYALYVTMVAHSAGHMKRALAEALIQHNMHPSDTFFPVCIALSYTALGNDAEALRFADLARTLGQPRDQAPLQDLYIELALRSGHFEHAAELARAALSPAMRAAGGDTVVTRVFSAIEDERGRAAAVAAMSELEATMTADRMGQIDMKRLLVWHAMLADLDSAHALAGRCLDRFLSAGTVGSAWGFLWRPEMLGFRHHPAFRPLVTRLGLPDYWTEYGPPDV